MIAPRCLWVLLWIVMAAACGDTPNHRSEPEGDGADTVEGDSGQDEPASEELDAAAPDTTSEDAGPAEDEDSAQPADLGDAETDDAEVVKNDSFETALAIEADGPAVLTDERAADQVDYFVFSGEAGQFYELTTNRGSFSPDNLISLYDADRTLIGENDDGWIWPGDAIDSRLVVRLPATGQYFVRVEDRFTPPEFFQGPSGIASLLYYVLRVRTITADSEGYAFAERASAGVQLQKHEASGYSYITLLGQFDTDADLFAFDGIADDLLVGHVHPSGPAGCGSTAGGGRVRVSVGNHVLAEIDRSKGQEFIHPPVSEGSHQLSISAEGTLGDNPFYALDLVLLPDNPREQSETTNGTLAGAEPFVLTGRQRRRGLLLATLGQGDIDYYSFDAMAGQQLAIGCEAESAGSGVRSLHAELRDAADNVLASADELVTKTLQLPIFLTATAGKYYLRLSGGAPAAGSAVEPWTRCSISVN